ncbi:MAG: alpha-amylase [Nitrospirae bacterium]|nr:alpha-amylase [Nitrospirota bacterium]
MIIYNLFPLLAGNFTEWDSHLTRASEMGFNWVFVNPVNLPGFSGSLYSIKDYFDFNPLIIDSKSKKKPQQQIKETIRHAEKLGLRMMMDLVINHCAIDSDLLKTNPEWFKWEANGEVSHPFALDNGKKVVWGDLAKFDHRNTKDKEGLFKFFMEVVKFLLTLGFKGFRCDAAYQIPKSFWSRLIIETKKINPEVFFFAETLGCTPDQTRRTSSAGFDYIFNSAKWWDFRNPWLMKQIAFFRDIVPSISFPESHDTIRLCEELNGNMEGLKQRYLFSALFSAGVMIPIGFEFGFRKSLHVVNTRSEDWETTNIDLTGFIKKVNEMKTGHVIFQQEAHTEVLHHGNPEVLFMWKAAGYANEEALIILNKDINNYQHFHEEDLWRFTAIETPLQDISPEYALDYIDTHFSYHLRPGQGIVLKTSRDDIEE